MGISLSQKLVGGVGQGVANINAKDENNDSLFPFLSSATLASGSLIIAVTLFEIQAF